MISSDDALMGCGKAAFDCVFTEFESARIREGEAPAEPRCSSGLRPDLSGLALPEWRSPSRNALRPEARGGKKTPDT